MKGAPIAASHPGMDLWRPSERMAVSEAAWLGAALGICMHAVLSFFELWMPSLGALLAVFTPAERFALGLAHGAPPFMRWVVLLAALATEGALLAVVVTSALREVAAALRRPHRTPRPLGGSATLGMSASVAVDRRLPPRTPR